jgi:hypothetical protein
MADGLNTTTREVGTSVLVFGLRKSEIEGFPVCPESRLDAHSEVSISQENADAISRSINLIQRKSIAVRIWHETVIAVQPPHVCCRSQSGKHVLALSFSDFGTFETCRRTLTMSVHRGRMEVMAGGQIDAFDPERTLALAGCL